MLKQLHIQNLAIIDKLELEFNAGMTVLTGETGAGKSILLDALGLILGDRGDSSIIRDGEDRAEIVATFDISLLQTVQPILEEQSINIDDNELIIRRVINRDGRSRAYVNASQIPVQLLRSLGECLVDIHGQHAHQSLMKRTAQRVLLDDYGGHTSVLEATAHACEHWRGVNERLAHISNDSSSHAATIDLLQYQVQELEELELREDEYDELEEEHRRLSSISELIGATRTTLELLCENEMSVDTALQRSIHELRELQKADPTTEKFVEVLDSIAIQVSEVVDDIRHYANRLETDPDRLDEVDRRLNTLHDMARKHHVHPRDLVPHYQSLQDRLEQLVNDRDSVKNLAAELEQADQQYRESADRLNAVRCKAATRMGKEISSRLSELGMSEGKFLVSVTPIENEHPLPEGQDQVEFQVSLNPGLAPQPLRKIASGGELSRISLAIQMASPDTRAMPTLIFDEVDAGIGGRTADIVGNLLKDLSARHQVFCVTHLPQVACRGGTHLQISKSAKKHATMTSVTVLAPDARVEEIARMLGGMRISEKTLEHAREMLGQEETTT